MSSTFCAKLPPSNYLKKILTRWTTLLSCESWWLHKISHTSHVPSFLGLIDLSKDISCAPEFSGRNCSHDIRELSKMSKVHTLFWKDRAFKYYHFVNSNSEHHVWDRCFFPFLFFPHIVFNNTVLLIFLPPCNLCVLGIHTCRCSTKNHHHFVERVFQQNCALWSLDKKRGSIMNV